MKSDWVFPSSAGGSDDGFYDAGMETYTGAPFNGLAREIIQNSLDAACGDKEKTKVTVKFDFLKINRDDFLGVEKLQSIMTLCLQECKKKRKSEKEMMFFLNAKKVLKKAEISCLKISDSGTTGLRGDYRNGSGQWYVMTKARGDSDKGDDNTAGGSYGIGKSAPFVVSALRTVFYSTFYRENGKSFYRAQGKSILRSHPIKINTDDYTQGTGFFGKTARCQPLDNRADIPKMLLLKDEGTVVFIPGFMADPQWQHKITSAVLVNFFYAIDQEKLEVSIRDEQGKITEIKKSSIGELFEKVSHEKIDKEEIDNAFCYYKALKKAKCRDSEGTLLGHRKIWIWKAEGLPKRIALLRKTGMLITDDQKELKRWAGRLDFAGVFFCDSEKGNELLRMMENPKHDAFEPDHASPEKRNQCRKALKELVEWVRKCVDAVAKPEDEDVSQLDELNEFLPDYDHQEKIPGDGDERNIEGKSIYSPMPLKRTKSKGTGADEDNGNEGGSGGGDGGDSSGGGTGVKGDDDNGGGNAGTVSSRSITIKNVRIVSNASNNLQKTIYFTPDEGGTIYLEMMIVGDDGGGERISISNPNKEIEKNVICEQVEKRKRVSIEVELSSDVSDSIALKAFKKINKIPENETATK